MLRKRKVIKLKFINQFSRTEIECFDLCIVLLSDEYKCCITGVLKNKEKILEYCQTIDIPKCSFMKRIYEKLRFYQVFPCHFYNIIDDE